MNWKILNIGFAVSVIAVSMLIATSKSANAMDLFGGNKADLGDLFVIDSLFNDSDSSRIFSKGETNLGDLFILDQLFNQDVVTTPTTPTPSVAPAVTTTRTLAQQLSGRILLQVESKGEAWYVNPASNQRVLLGTPSQMIAKIGSLSIGISNKDFDSLSTSGIPNRLVGRFLIKTEDEGKLFYVNPVSRQLTEINNATEATNLIKQVGLGISNSDISKITVAN